MPTTRLPPKRAKRRWFGFKPAPPAAPPDPARFDEAVDFFRRRVPMPKAQWLKLGTEARQRGFTVADVAQLDVIHQVWLALDDSIARGSTFAEFQATVGETLKAEWQGGVANPPARVETIFRTNVMTANNAGRHAQMTDPVVAARRPFWQYVDIDDQRECPICTACHGTILPMDDPWWETHHPPLHFQCRCRARPLTEAQAVAGAPAAVARRHVPGHAGDRIHHHRDDEAWYVLEGTLCVQKGEDVVEVPCVVNANGRGPRLGMDATTAEFEEELKTRVQHL
jgi:SPP1 gp7 family putative phage head morphogenesis protein